MRNTTEPACVESSGPRDAFARDPACTTRHCVYGLLITMAVGLVTGRLLNTVNLIEPWTSRWPASRPATVPTLSSNDRSRWATIRALVDEGTYAVGKREIDVQNGKYVDSGLRFDPAYAGVDYVLNPADNQFYSSKPPLLSTLLAGLYWLLQQVTGWTLAQHMPEVTRSMLFLVNVLPLAGYLVVFYRLVERYGQTDWGRLYVAAAAALGTLLTTFSVTLNNHLPAAFCTLFATYYSLKVWNDEEARPWIFGLIGLLVGFAVTCELPAAAFALGIFLLLLRKTSKPTLLGFVPAAALVALGMSVTNYLAIGRLTTFAYEFQSIEDPAHQDYLWYHYEGSHWSKEKISGIDAAHEPKHVYAWHALFGHHGIFSHTPLFLLSLVGAGLCYRRAPRLRMLAALTAVVSVVVLGFYIMNTNNYGGNTSGFRWSFWLIPLWLLVMLPAADVLSACRKGRSVGLVLLGISVLSVSFPTWNPWRPNWPFRLLEHWKVIDYSPKSQKLPPSVPPQEADKISFLRGAADVSPLINIEFRFSSASLHWPLAKP